jgi:hypothetical protein
MNDKANKNIPDIDWVSKRAECCLTSVFLTLKAGAERDVKTRNNTICREDRGERRGFGFKDNGESFSIFTEAAPVTKILDFKLLDHHITVNSEGSVILKAGITLNNQCECKLVADGEELYDWQFRKMALEKLFFGER